MTEAAAATSTTSLPALVRVMVNPRAAMRSILDRSKRRGLILLVLAAFFSSLIAQTNWKSFAAAGREQGTLFIAGVASFGVIVAIVVAVAVYFLFAWSALFAGRFLGGTGTFADVRAAVAWGAAPFVWALIYRVPATIFWTDAYLALHGGERPLLELSAAGLDFVIGGSPEVPMMQLLLLAVLDLLLIAAYLYVGSSTLAEAHGISSWHGLGTLLLMIIMPFALLLVIALAVALTQG